MNQDNLSPQSAALSEARPLANPSVSPNGDQQSTSRPRVSSHPPRPKRWSGRRKLLTGGGLIVLRQGAIGPADLDRALAVTGPEADSVH